MIKVYCKFCLQLVDTLEDKSYDKTVFIYCTQCKQVIGYTI